MRYLILGLLLAAAPSAFAQTTSGVVSPTVNDGHKSAQYRVTYDPDSEGLSQRVHYQQSINGDLRWRTVVSARKTTDSDVDLDYVQAELLWQLSDDDARWKYGLRFDGRIRDDDRPGQFGIHWTNQIPVSEGWTARFGTFTSVDVGDDARDGVFLQTRGNLFTKLETGQTVGVEFYNSYGSTDNIKDFEDQRHQIGPFASFPVTEKLSLFTGALFGVTDGSADAELRVRVSRGF